MFNWFWRFLYSLVKTIFYCIDFIMMFAKKLAGIEPVVVDYEERELTDYFLQSDSVMQAVKNVSLIAVVLIFLFAIFAVIRSIGKMGEDKTAGQVLFGVMKTMFYLFMVPVIMIIGSAFITAVMTAVYRATAPDGASLGSSLFVLIAEEAFDGAENKQNVLENFRNQLSGYDYYSTSQVDAHFDLSDLNYFLAFVGGIAVLVLIVKPMLTFVERIVSLVFLFVVAPLSVSTSLLDDGMRFKLWRDQVLNKFLTAYGALISLNVFILMLGVINRIDFFTYVQEDGSVVVDTFKTGLARLLFIIGGAAATNMGVVLFGNLINNGAGSQYAADRAHLSAPMARLGHIAGGAAIGAMHAVGRSAPAQKAVGTVRDMGNRAAQKLHSGASRASGVAKGLAGRAADKTGVSQAAHTVKAGASKAYDRTFGAVGRKASDLGRRIEGYALGNKSAGGSGGSVSNSAPNGKAEAPANRANADAIINALPSKGASGSADDSKKTGK